MYKTNYLLVCFSLIAILVGCTKQSPKCTFPDAPNIKAPVWVCNQAPQGVEVFAVGFAENSGVGKNFDKQMAATDARVHLAQRMRMYVAEMIKSHVESIGVNEANKLNSDLGAINNLVLSETHLFAKIIDQVKSPTGLYVMVVVEPEIVKQAVWKQFNAKKDLTD